MKALDTKKKPKNGENKAGNSVTGENKAGKSVVSENNSIASENNSIASENKARKETVREKTASNSVASEKLLGENLAGKKKAGKEVVNNPNLAAKIGRKTGVGAVFLIASGMICKALGAFFRLPLTNLLGVEGIGVFQLFMALFAFALVVASGGVTAALSKLISAARAKSNFFAIGQYLLRAFLVCCASALAIGVVFVLFSNQIAALQGVDSGQTYLLFVVLLPLGAALAVFRGYFQGFENMTPTAISQVIEQVFKFALGLLFAAYFARFGVLQGVFGAFLGIVASELVAFAYLVLVFLHKNKLWKKNENKNFVAQENLQKDACKEEKLKKKLKTIARKQFDSANFLLMFSAVVLPLVAAFDALVIVPRLSAAGFSAAQATQLFGIQTGIVGTFLNFPLVISVAVATALLPNISYQISRGLGGHRLTERGLKILIFLILPTTFGLVAVFRPAFLLLYPSLGAQTLSLAFDLIFFGAFSTIFTATMQYLVMLLQANGQFRFILLAMAVGGAFKAVLSFCLAAVPQINIFAITIGNIAMGGIVCVLALWRLKKTVAFRVAGWDMFLLSFATVCMFLAVFTFVRTSPFGTAITLVLGILIGVIVYLVFSVPVALGIVKNKQKGANKKNKNINIQHKI